MQNGWNCIVTALANVLWYWGNNDYGYLNLDITFGKMQREIRDLFREINSDSFRNNDVPEVLYTYVKSKNRYYSSTSNVFWNPTISKVVNQIDNGKPCLVGFAAGENSYSEVEGHMTACFGYQNIGGAYQIVLADGHSASLVYKTWTSYNDCVITINLSK
ncbi:MAG: C39 family peptidase [Lachnospiraceae bacterium]|nr:C39 family peptidase [Lachnospiraceae bacterium]